MNTKSFNQSGFTLVEIAIVLLIVAILLGYTVAMFPRQQELPDLGVAETVDRLHRIADTKERTAVAGLPAARQRFKHPVLRAGRVLHLVDKDMTNLVIEQQRDVARRVGTSEGRAGCKCDFDVIRNPLLRKQPFQFRHREG